MIEWVAFSKILAALLAVVDPVGLVPIFIAMTQGMPRETKKIVVKQASLTAAIVMFVAVFAGEHILGFFGIRIAAFQVVGGILILMMAFSMLNAETGRTKRTPEEEEEASHKQDISVVPLGIPLIAGPGAISALILYAQQAKGPLDTGLLLAACLITALITFITLRLADPLAHKLGQTGVNIVTRIMGLILAAVAIEFFAHGLEGLFPILTQVSATPA